MRMERWKSKRFPALGNSANFSKHLESESVSHSVVSLCDPTDCSLPGSSVHGILQTRILE